MASKGSVFCILGAVWNGTGSGKLFYVWIFAARALSVHVRLKGPQIYLKQRFETRKADPTTVDTTEAAGT